MMIRHILRNLVRTPRDFIPLFRLNDNNVPALRDTAPRDVQTLHGTNDHLRVSAPSEFRTGHTDTEIGVAEVVVDGPSPGIPAEKIGVGEIDLREGVLVAANDDGGAIAVEEEDVCLWVSGKEVCFKSEIEVRVCGARKDGAL